ncbi:MAG: hypothetical protein WBC18_12160 [Ottowia sp.]|uniref:hypothetical protein n=1 Tax=unclassified Ottowia TaxID=2645081 RepID=UPI003C2D6F6E
MPRCFLALSLIAALTACAAWRDAPRLSYRCANDLRFEARLYQDMAILEGTTGHAVLARANDDKVAKEPVYADDTVQARFGLGVDGRLTRLDYTNIPEPVYCERVLAPGEEAQAQAADRPGPRPPPPPPDPNAPVLTNIRTGEGPIGGG